MGVTSVNMINTVALFHSVYLIVGYFVPFRRHQFESLRPVQWPRLVQTLQEEEAF